MPDRRSPFTKSNSATTLPLTDLRAEIAWRLKNRTQAIDWLQKILRHEGSSLHVLWRLGDFYDQRGTKDKAEKAWKKAAVLGQGHHELGKLYQQLAAAERTANRPAESARYEFLATLSLGKNALWRGEYFQARDLLDQAIQQNPDEADAWYYLAESRRLLGETALARAAYVRCLDLNPDHGRALRGSALLGEFVQP